MRFRKRNETDGNRYSQVLSTEIKTSEAGGGQEGKKSFLKENRQHEKKQKSEKPPRDKSSGTKKKAGIILGIIIGAFLAVYLGIAVYFTSHFEFNTKMNGLDISGKTVQEVAAILENSENTYALTLETKEGKTEAIEGKEISLSYVSDDEIEKSLKNQNPFIWPVSLFNKGTDMNATMTYDEAQLDQKIKSLNMISGPNIIKPQDAHPFYNGTAYAIEEGHTGNELNEEKLKETVNAAVLAGEKNINLKEKQCYLGNNFVKDSPEVIAAKDTLNHYIATTLTYTFGEATEVLNKETINTWLNADENMAVHINADQVENYLYTLSDKYDTYGKPRNFNTSGGGTIQIDGGDYGWLIDIEGETQEVIAIVAAGKPTTREPLYASTGGPRGGSDFGNTYVEISLGGQHMWFYKNGALIADTDVVTGTADTEYATPSGVFTLDYKALDVTLKGEGYASPVTFWMPYDGDIGIHDASWRSTFGGDIYSGGGSHGCVNTPYPAAEAIYNTIEEGDLVIVY